MASLFAVWGGKHRQKGLGSLSHRGCLPAGSSSKYLASSKVAVFPSSSRLEQRLNVYSTWSRALNCFKFGNWFMCNLFTVTDCTAGFKVQGWRKLSGNKVTCSCEIWEWLVGNDVLSSNSDLLSYTIGIYVPATGVVDEGRAGLSPPQYVPFFLSFASSVPQRISFSFQGISWIWDLNSELLRVSALQILL